MRKSVLWTMVALGVLLVGRKKDGPGGKEAADKWESYEGAGFADLGLPSGTVWASCNVGATKPEEYGNFYSWGEVATKQYFTINNYKYGSGVSDRFTKITKYSFDNGFSCNDQKETLEILDDAASQVMGGSWRMPTKADWEELFATRSDTKHYKWKYDQVNSVSGLKIKNLTTGACLFFPSAGYVYEGKDPSGVAAEGYYWSSTLVHGTPHDSSERAYSISFTWQYTYDVNRIMKNRNGDEVFGELRFRGMSVRGVKVVKG